MIKISTFIITSLFLINSTILAQWVSLDNSSLPNSQPEIQILSDDITSTVVKVNLPGLMIGEFDAEGKTYHAIDLGSEAITTEIGFPEIPHFAKVLAIPYQGTVSVEVIETGESKIIEGINLPPARESWIEGKPETNYIENQAAYSSSSLYPQEIVKIEDPAVFRDFRIARVSIFPLRYSPATKQIEIYSSITIRINYGSGMGINPKLTPKKPIAPSFAKLYRSFIFNYDEVLQREYHGDELGFDFMLCIVPDVLEPDFQTYAGWKHKTGTYIHVTKFSDIGANENTPNIVKDHILDAYTNWENTPTHVLIVGDDGVAPVKYISYDFTFVYENYFVELEGGDYFPEMMIGRFTNQGDYRLRTMINKFIGYEKTPYIAEPDWFRKGLVCSNDAYISQIYTKRFTASKMLEEDGNFLSVDSMYNGYPCPGNVGDIINMINEGRSFLNYRGEGWSSGWWADCIPFQTSDVSTLNNGEKLTFVTSIGCGVAMFDANGGNCFGEAWVQLGAEFEPRGACAFVGPTSNTHTTYNNKIDMGIYMGMFSEGMDSPGEGLNRGRLYMYEVFGNTYWVEYHYRVYCVLGDPSLHVWKDTPENINVTYTDTVVVGFGQPQVSVNFSSSGNPVANAEVCISGNGVYEVGKTSPGGLLTLDINATGVGELDLVVRGKKVVPFEGTIYVVEGEENVAPTRRPVVTDIDGNNDGLINPNENCTITYTLKNYGTQIAQDVFAKLTVHDSVANIVEIVTTDSVNFGTLAPNDSMQGSPFQFFVKPACKVGSVIPFKLHVYSTTKSWNYYRNEVVHGCQLQYSDSFIDDDGNLLKNYRMDPGETVNVFLTINNIGDDVAPDVKGILRSNDQYITILDSVGLFETIQIDSSAKNITDYFTVKVSSNCPIPYSASYSLQLETQNGLYQYSIVDTFSIPIAKPSVYDPSGPDQYGYYAYSSEDNLWQQSPEFDWFEISGIGTEIPRGGASDLTVTTNIPFSFRYYGINYSQIRISTDGWIAPGSGTLTASQNYPLPRADGINNMIGVFWDDLFSNNPQETGKLYYYNDAANHRFIVEWSEVGHSDDYTNRETFQVILLDPAFYPTQTGDGEIICQYKVVTEPGSSTIGIENNNEDIGLLYVFDDIYSVTANELTDNFAIKITTDSATVVSVGNENTSENILPTEYALYQNYPNPFNPETKIRYDLPESGYVALRIFRIDGQLVRTLQNSDQPQGRYELTWDGKNDFGYKAGSGVYFYQLLAGNFVQTKKLILLK